jgi:hypothetical protein
MGIFLQVTLLREEGITVEKRQNGKRERMISVMESKE